MNTEILEMLNSCGGDLTTLQSWSCIGLLDIFLASVLTLSQTPCPPPSVGLDLVSSWTRWVCYIYKSDQAEDNIYGFTNFGLSLKSSHRIGALTTTTSTHGSSLSLWLYQQSQAEKGRHWETISFLN